MRCITHKKSIIGGCFWCGQRICNHCVTKSDGKKFYCGKCTSELDKFLRRKISPMELYVR